MSIYKVIRFIRIFCVTFAYSVMTAGIHFSITPAMSIYNKSISFGLIIKIFRLHVSIDLNISLNTINTRSKPMY
jgi:hypothetical protein